jgi:hypothetical protein
MTIQDDIKLVRESIPGRPLMPWCERAHDALDRLEAALSRKPVDVEGLKIELHAAVERDHAVEACPLTIDAVIDHLASRGLINGGVDAPSLAKSISDQCMPIPQSWKEEQSCLDEAANKLSRKPEADPKDVDALHLITCAISNAKAGNRDVVFDIEEALFLQEALTRPKEPPIPGLAKSITEAENAVMKLLTPGSEVYCHMENLIEAAKRELARGME